MSTYTEILPSCKSSAHPTINWTPAEGDTPLAGVLTIHTDRDTSAYAVSEFPNDWAGRSFTVAKITSDATPEGESYSVFCGDHGAKLCECRGFQRWARCKHTDAIQALIENRWV